MRTLHDVIRERLLAAVRLPPREQPDCLDPREIAERQVDWVFLERMVARLVMGWFRYGDNRDPRLPRHDHVARIRLCCDLYEESGNLEHLVDIANMAMLEEMKAPIGRGTLPPEKLHFRSIDDDPEIHTDELAK